MFGKLATNSSISVPGVLGPIIPNLFYKLYAKFVKNSMRFSEKITRKDFEKWLRGYLMFTSTVKHRIHFWGVGLAIGRAICVFDLNICWPKICTWNTVMRVAKINCYKSCTLFRLNLMQLNISFKKIVSIAKINVQICG